MVCKDRKKLKIEREKEKSMDRSLPFYQDSWGIGLIWVSGSKCMGGKGAAIATLCGF